MSNCQSCGMPMEKPEDYGGGRVDNSYCKHCTDDQGKLLPKDEVREKMIQFQMQNLNKTEEEAEADVDKHMALMQAWKLGPSQPVSPSQPTVPPASPASQPSDLPADDAQSQTDQPLSGSTSVFVPEPPKKESVAPPVVEPVPERPMMPGTEEPKPETITGSTPPMVEPVESKEEPTTS